MKSASPLRYPGGKWRLSGFASEFIVRNFRYAPLYIEPYAGGASLALSLLFTEKVSGIWLNDLDPAIFACWHSMLTQTQRFCEKIERVPLTIVERQKQKMLYRSRGNGDIFSFGFATFLLNRTNHSGIMNGGVIGGKAQAGRWKIDARFNRRELIKRVKRLAGYREQIKLTCIDAGLLLHRLRASSTSLVYLDPPYVSVGSALYMNSYDEAAHISIRNTVRDLQRKWIVSYDDVPFVRKLYRNYRARDLELLHTAREAKIGQEVLFFSKGSVIPKLPVRNGGIVN